MSRAKSNETAGPSLVTLRRAAFGYGTTPIVSDVDLDVARGAFVAILGPNGSGKTTLVRGLLGLVPPMSGTIERPEARFGYVPQRETLDPVYPLSVEEVVQMGAYGRLRGTRALSAADRARASTCLERVDLVGKRKARFSSLSGGQRQRVLIARALAMNPNVLVLDEPTSGVDQRTQRLVHELLSSLSRDDDLAVLIVSHQLAMTRGVRDVLWVADGRVRRGSSEEVLRPDVLERLFGVPVEVE